jgi:hypothetical protein
MKSTNVKGVSLSVFLLLAMMLASHTFSEAGTKSEGTAFFDIFTAEPPTDCGTAPGVVSVDHTGRGVDSSFGPYLIELNGCLDGSAFSIENPYAAAFDQQLTFTRLWNDGPDSSTLVVTCEDFEFFYDVPICVGIATTSVRCRVTEATGSFQGAKGFLDFYGAIPLDFCSGADFGTFVWYTMHLTFPLGPKD